MARPQIRIVWHGSKITRENRDRARLAILMAVEELLTRANVHVPHDEGNLESTGEASVATYDLIGAVSYDTPYAVRLYEHPEYKFQEAPTRHGKWLEETFNDSGEEVLKWLQKEMQF